ncbi:MAG: EamA family transporter RarD [Desulfobacteraceae bacterium]|nr:EamA family transporter RarD [Desulfobacteraceae bacterium]
MTEEERGSQGYAFLVTAYTIWGLSPAYWKCLAQVPALELLLHRTVWSFVFLMALVVLRKKTSELTLALTSPRTLLSLLGSTLILAFNWFLFIWSVNNGHVLQTSLGYYINPLIMVLLAMLFLKERLTPLKWLALLVATAGVVYYAVGLGRFPWIALALAVSFGFYSLFHKITRVTSVTGICVETLLLTLPAMAYLIFLNTQGRGAMFAMGTGTDLMLLGTTLVTALPLLLFTMGARKVPLATVGFMQYMAPTMSFMLAVFVFDEPFSSKQLVTFVMIWAALALYSADSLFMMRRAGRSLKK